MMRLVRFSGLSIFVGTLLSVGVTNRARGQAIGTATPVPSPTPTVVLPSGSDLLTQMQSVVKAKNTVHVSEQSDIEVPSSLRVVSTVVEDISMKPQLARAVATTQTTRLQTSPARTITQHEHVIVVKTREAVRIGKKPWTCGTISAPTVPVKADTVTNLGAETLDSVPVWHVREIASVVVGAATVVDSQTVPVTADFYISQADSTLLKATTSDSYSSQGVTATSTTVQTYTNYGEPLHVKLPKACKSKAVAADLFLQSLLSESFPRFAAVWRKAG